MDVAHKVLSLLFCAIFLSSCGANTGAQNQNQFSSSDKAKCTSAEIKDRFIVKWKSGRISRESAFDREHFKHGFMVENSDQIEFAEHDYRVQIDARESVASTVNTVSALPTSWGQQMVQAPSAWSAGANGGGVIVAVIDSGVDYNHPQLVNQIALNVGEMGMDSKGHDKTNNNIDDDGNGYIDDFRGYNFAPDDPLPTPHQALNNPMDTNEHGTHVSGIIAAQHSAGPIQGMAEQAKILPLRFINASGGGSVGSAIEAIQYAVKANAKVINASWGGSDCSVALQQAISGLEAKGVVFVAAAGNDGKNLESAPSYPAAFSFPGQITVLATTELDAQAEFSNYSFTLAQIGAPGVGIVSTVPNSGTKSLDGTSMATPFVTGAVAMLFGVKPNASVAQVKNALLKSIDLTQVADSAGGRLNIKKAVDFFKSL